MHRIVRLVAALLLLATVSVSVASATSASRAQHTPTASAPRLQPVGDAMAAGRASHTATLLPDGDVLIAGGFVDERTSLESMERFDPATGTFAPAAGMMTPRNSHTATLLPNGRVLLAGGFNGDYLDTAEIYDPATNTVVNIAPLTRARSGHVAVLLASGDVLLVGGVGEGWTFLDDAEIFRSDTMSFSPAGRMRVARESHTATVLDDGQVLIAGGHAGRRADLVIHASAEIYDPATQSFAPAGDLMIRRHKHDAARLQDGTVMIVGGADERDGDAPYRSTEVYDPASRTFTPGSDLNIPRYKLQGTSVMLANGQLVIAGGATSVEIFDPVTRSFTVIEGMMADVRLFSTATLLHDGRILITGGYGSTVAASNRAWIVAPI